MRNGRPCKHSRKQYTSQQAGTQESKSIKDLVAGKALGFLALRRAVPILEVPRVLEGEGISEEEAAIGSQRASVIPANVATAALEKHIEPQFRSQLGLNYENLDLILRRMPFLTI